MSELNVAEKVYQANTLLQEARDKVEWNQKLFMRKARFSEDDFISKMPRREGKTFTLKKLVKPVFKKERKNFQYLNAVKRSRKHKVIKKETQVLLVDDCWNAVVNFIKTNRPDIRIVGLKSTWGKEEDQMVEKEFESMKFEHIEFEK